ncbi:hypothetical protein [Rhizobium sp. AB2/73]|uniref:hypothetical protein n=1 Tax=Rhizobium sp. AB2/73 TaxID=2795216 RepID=UPI000DDE70F7|nr:hypothetical protein [Rhizobium sp. AB2/73]QYA15928.1 hypothetical protein J5284_28455 [Rhizobium sp. AB2/73]UEQ84471.1 hypothetical protein I8E17_29785 [Rhizobium sp. AB2/73]
MYFPALLKAIQALEEKAFYNVAIMCLEQLGYRDLSIVDGPGDGGKDVVCSRPDVRIQLSVRKTWEQKINEEAANTEAAGLRHFVYVTNRAITPDDQDEFLDTQYRYKGIVDLTIIDLRRVATSLTRPSVIREAYELLGLRIPAELVADPKDVTISTLLMFSKDAKDLKEEFIEASIRARLLHVEGIPEEQLIENVAAALPGINIDRSARAALSRLRIAGRVKGAATAVKLSDSEVKKMQAAETEYLAAREIDLAAVAKVTRLNVEDSGKLLGLALELLVRDENLDGLGPIEQAIRSFLAEKRLEHKRDEIYEVLSKTNLSKLKQYGKAVSQIFATNTFDIYRALGRRTDIKVVLDSSVAMPVLFGLSFGGARSRYGVAALALKTALVQHKIAAVVPRPYLNEMAAHGRAAIALVDAYGALPRDAKRSLRSSENAYLSHFAHIEETMEEKGESISLGEFLAYFGIQAGRSLDKVENKIESLLDSHGIKVITCPKTDQTVFRSMSAAKKYHDKYIIDHDAAVATLLKNDDEHGYILSTWDKTMMDFVEDLIRVYADTPARVIDFLSMAGPSNFASEQNYELISTLLHIDEKRAVPLAEKIASIRTAEQAFKLDQIIQGARKLHGAAWELKAEHVAPLLDEANDQAVRPDRADHH